MVRNGGGNAPTTVACGRSARHGRGRGWLRRQPTSDTEQLAGELAEVKADRDHLAGLVEQLATTSATLEAYTINDRQGCLKTLRRYVSESTTPALP
jgi:hypothetical protein